MFQKEVRINRYYASLLDSKYEEDSDSESEPVIRNNLLRADKFFKQLSGSMGHKHILPPNTRFHEKFVNGEIFVVEDPPSIRTILVDADLHGLYESLRSDGKIEEYGIENFFDENPFRPYKFTLAFPYTIFVLSVSPHGSPFTTSVFFRTQQLIGLSDNIMLAPLYNIPNNQ